jgi:biopolymer transport protein ExbD
LARSLSGAPRKPRSAEDDELDITPMIDVTFLLLIFFMVASNMQKPSSLEIPPATHGTGIDKSNATVLTIFKTDNEPEIYLSDGEKENGPVSLPDVTAYVQRGVNENKLTVIIKADRDIPSGFVEDVARAASEVEAELKYYVGVMDKPQ